VSIAPFLAPERDGPAKVGRAAKSGTDYGVVPGATMIGQGTSGALSSGTDYYTPWVASSPIVIDRLISEITTGAGTNFRMGFYAADSSWQPVGAPMADSGNLDAASTGVKTYTPGTAIYVPRGRYLSVVNCDGAAALRVVRGGLSGLDTSLGVNPVFTFMVVTRAYAAFPTPGTTWTTPIGGSNGTNHLVIYRVTKA
jgi:hypothetical protein